MRSLLMCAMVGVWGGVCHPTAASGQQGATGYDVDDPTILAKCTGCHTRDDEGRLSRISYLRKTPEGWEQSLRRMIGLHGVQVSADEARAVVRYLADHQGLAPEELRPGRFEVERRMIDYEYPGDSAIVETCTKCHSLGRVITQRRTKEEWGLLVATHRALYPLSDFQAFRLTTREGDERQPMDVAIDRLSEAYPLETAEWAAWSATMRSPRLAGEWSLSGYEPGKGPLYGRVTISADPDDPDAFNTRSTYVFSESGERVQRTGRALVYTGYQWRGRSDPGQDSELREVMLVERDLQSMSGRWFAGAYDERGPDVTLRRIGADPVVSGVYPRGLRQGDRTSVTVYGANLGQAVAGDFDLGEGVSVEGVGSRSEGSVELRVAVDPSARVGARDLYARGASLPRAVAVHDGVDRIVVTPRTGMARLGGANAPKGYQSFEAIAYDDGPDGTPDTDDDLSLGRVPASWSLEEYAAVYGDDDIDFVGRIRQDGTFEPALDGPDPDRSGNRDNVGDVWVVAKYKTPGGDELSARAHLIVTVPLFIRFNPWPAGGEERPPVSEP